MEDGDEVDATKAADHSGAPRHTPATTTLHAFFAFPAAPTSLLKVTRPFRRHPHRVAGDVKITSPHTLCISGEDAHRPGVVGVRAAVGKAQPFAARLRPRLS